MSLELARLVEADEVIDYCRRLVRVPSENPPGDERDAAKVCVDILDEIGIESEIIEGAENRTSVVATWGQGDRALAFNGHIDVVPAMDVSLWPHPPFGAEIHDGKMFGRGTSDMKAGIAAALAAVSTLKRNDFTPAGRIVLQLVADEEAMGVFGTKVLVDRGYCEGITEAIVGEPTEFHLVTAERGAWWLKIVTEGVPAHGSTPALGVNAIEHMARIVTKVQSMRWRKLHELLGGPSVNVGVISGGSKTNIVPDHCVIEVDRRTIPGESIEEVTSEFQAVLDELHEQIPELKARIETGQWAGASETPEGTRMVDLLDAARGELGIEGYEIGYSGATDARYLINEAGVPAVIFGPGDLKVAHTIGEFVRVDQLVDGARVYAHAFASFFD